MDTARMIYSEMKVAQLVLGKMKRRHPSLEWSIIDAPVGFQVTQKSQLATVTLTYGGQSPAFIECNFNGKKIWIGKSVLLSYDVEYGSKTIVMDMRTAYAKKRGFILTCITDPMGRRIDLSQRSTMTLASVWLRLRQSERETARSARNSPWRVAKA